MDKAEFLKKIINLYDDFNEKNTSSRIEAYNTVLVGKIDYSKLYLKLIQTYKSLSFAPSPSVLFTIIENLKHEKEMAEFIAQRQLAEKKQEQDNRHYRSEISEEERARIIEIQKQFKNFKFDEAIND